MTNDSSECACDAAQRVFQAGGEPPPHEPGLLVRLEQPQIEVVLRNIEGGAENVQDIYPLSPLQEGMLFHHVLNAKSDTYILSTLFELQTERHVDVLVDALHRVIERHEVLRSCVLWEKLPRPVQVVQRHAQLQVESLTPMAGGESLRQLRNLMKPGQRGLNVQQAPLLRLLTATDDRRGKWYALLQIHHLICDYRSWRVVVREVLAYARGRGQDIPERASHREYLTWALAQACERDAEVFFRSKLSHIREPIAPFGLLDVHGDARHVREARRTLDHSFACEIRGQARVLCSTAARLFHAAWALVVAATSGRDEVVYGTALICAPPGHSHRFSSVGMAVSTLPLRLELRDVTARELLEQTHREIDELRKHQLSPLVLAQRCSGVAGTAALFTTLLNYRHAVPDTLGEGEAATGIKVLAYGDAWTNYPVSVTVDDDGEGFALQVHTERSIDPDRIVGYLEAAIRSLLEALSRAPRTAALSLSVLPADERLQILETFNATRVEHSNEKLIHELFEAQVERTPLAVAVQHCQQSVTYAQLNAKANQFARYLRELGCGPDRRVALCVERGIDMVVGVLATLKAGAAYVPLDPNYPPERLRYMLEDARPAIVLVQEAQDLAAISTGAAILKLSSSLQQVATASTQNLQSAALGLTSDDLLYVIYTSGSTGRPKGTAMPHRSMVNLIEWHRRALPVAEGLRVLQFAALSFDVAFQEIFSTLCGGATLVLLDEVTRRDSRALLELLQRQSIGRVFLPPVMLQSIAEQFRGMAGTLDALRDVITAGEQLKISPEIVSFFRRIPGCRLHNHYGPTETHVVTALTLSSAAEDWPVLPTIGKPISNTCIYVLDSRRQPVPLGATGEIYIGGANPARGYLDRPELSAERFVPDLFSADLGARMYKTGDLGRWKVDGTLEYLGRNDDQVKIRGFRVELGEVEAQLARHSAVREAVVVAREDVQGGGCLVAYVTPRGSSRLDVETLRAYAKSVLPDFMVPSAYVILDVLPLTPSGKIARRSLPAPRLEAYARREHETPRGEVEEALARIWQEILGVEQVGRGDNFFELGGNSLHGMRLMSAISERLESRLPVVTLFQYPTIDELAAILISMRALEANPARFLQSRGEGGEFDEGVIGAAP
jgi:amino acid adenylation domain-containing protein